MTRDELIERVCNKVNNSDKLPVSDMENKKKCKTSDYKKGLYFLFDKNDTCIYVGKVGEGPFTSLYHRMVGHGNGSHKTKDKRWYKKVLYGKWHQFNVSGKQLALLERMAILGMKQPIYNDVDSDQETIDKINEQIVS